jgi:hypothetical protein
MLGHPMAATATTIPLIMHCATDRDRAADVVVLI